MVKVFYISDEDYTGQLPFEGQTVAPSTVTGGTDEHDNYGGGALGIEPNIGQSIRDAGNQMGNMNALAGDAVDASKKVDSPELDALFAQANQEDDILAKIGLGMRDKLYLSEYALMTFSYRTSPLESRKFQNTEIEYIIGGYKSPNFNCMDTNAKIMLVRTGLNFVSIEQDEYIKNINPALAFACSLVIKLPQKVWQIIIRLAESAIEAFLQVGTLLQGDDVPFVIGPKGDLQISKIIDEAIQVDIGLKPSDNTKFGPPTLKEQKMNRIKRLIKNKPSPKDGDNSNDDKLGAGWQNIEWDTDYEFYLRGILWMDMITREETDLQRMQNLLKMGIEKNAGENGSSDLTEYAIYLKGSLAVSIKSLIPNFGAVNVKWNGIPGRHVIRVESVRGY